MAEETITRDELAAYYMLNGASSPAVAEEAAAGAFAWAAGQREPEPEYEPGVMYQDAAGQFWLYEPPPRTAANVAGSWLECPWLKPGSAGAFSAGAPEQPLRRLVPEQEDAEGSAEWCIAWGGEDANDCAGRLEYDDQAEAEEMRQWIDGGIVARRTVTRSRWVTVPEEADHG